MFDETRPLWFRLSMMGHIAYHLSLDDSTTSYSRLKHATEMAALSTLSVGIFATNAYPSPTAASNPPITSRSLIGVPAYGPENDRDRTFSSAHTKSS